MTIDRRYLTKYEKSMHIHIPEEQRTAILERFGVEPAPYEWSEQDIAVQIQNYLGCDEFVKMIDSNNEYTRVLRGDREPVCPPDNGEF